MLLELRDLVVAYQARHGVLRAVAGIDLGVDVGATVGLVGESGSGKSTVARAIVGLTPVASGSLLVDGLDITHDAEGRTHLSVESSLCFRIPTRP